MSKIEIAVRKKGNFAGQSLVYRFNEENKSEEFMVLLRQAISDGHDDIIRLWDHERFVYAHYNGDQKSVLNFLKTLGFSFPKSYKDSKGKEVQFKNLAEQFTELGKQGFTCESKTAEWDIVSTRTIKVPDDQDCACNADGEILYLHKPENMQSVVIGGKTYFTGEYTVNTDEGEDGMPFFETKTLVKKAPARVVFTKDVYQWASDSKESTAAVERPVFVEDNGLV